MKSIIKGKIDPLLFSYPTFLFGAGSTGKACFPLLESEIGIVSGNNISENQDKNHKIEIINFVDEDILKHNKKLFNIKIISLEEMKKKCETLDFANVILTSIYAKSIINKLKDIENIQIYEICSLFENFFSSTRICENKEDIKKFLIEIKKLKPKLSDEYSYLTLQGLYKYMLNQDINEIINICTEEEHYFIKEVLNSIGDKQLNIIDAGAYEGELLRVLQENNIKINKWYCFEPDKDNFNQLKKNLAQLEKNNVVICENLGLWKENTTLYFEQNDARSRIVKNQTDYYIPVTSIDSYFKNSSINYIKMDIEGSELDALKGGINVIKRDRPILAISIYHNLEHFYKIPNYLMEHLENYHYYIRHHSIILNETVLYAIPIS